MNRNTENLVIIQQRFTNFEVFSSSLKGYDTDVKQIDNGCFSAFVQNIQSGPVAINRFTTTRRFEANGKPPPGVRTFGIPTTNCQPFVWRGKKTSGNTIQIYGPGTELALITHPQFEAIDISITEEDFNSLNQLWDFPDLDKMIGSREMIECDPAIMQRLRDTLQVICSSIDNSTTHSSQYSKLQSLIEHQVPYLLAQALMASETYSIKETAAKRNHALRTAIEYIKSASDGTISIHKFCHDTGINERTLQRAFLEQYNVTPKSYIQMQRLNKAYKVLLYSDPDTTRITDVATSHGYWHMSQFAGDYRRLFGELPSDTLKQ